MPIAERPGSAWAIELAVAVELAARAGRLLVERLDDAGPVAFKGVRDIVTEVDHASEALIRGDLAERFPGDGFYGEEGGRDATVTPAPGSAIRSTAPSTTRTASRSSASRWPSWSAGAPWPA